MHAARSEAHASTRGGARAPGSKVGKMRARLLRRQQSRATRAGRAPSARARRLDVVQQAVLVIHPARRRRQLRRRGGRATKTRPRKHRAAGPMQRAPRGRAPVLAVPLVALHQHQRGGALVGFLATQVARAKHVLLPARGRSAAVRHRVAGRPREGGEGGARVLTSAPQRGAPRQRQCSQDLGPLAAGKDRPGRPMPMLSTVRSCRMHAARGTSRLRSAPSTHAHRGGSCAHTHHLEPSTRGGDSQRLGWQRGCASRKAQAPSSDTAARGARASNAPSLALCVSARQRVAPSMMFVCPGSACRSMERQRCSARAAQRRWRRACTPFRKLGAAAAARVRCCNVSERREPARLRAAAWPGAARTPGAERTRHARVAAAEWRRRRTARAATQAGVTGCAVAAMAWCMAQGAVARSRWNFTRLIE